MTLDIHRPHPGVVLVVSQYGSVLLGAPADAFKATKKYCNEHNLPFPREIVSPQRMLVQASPQFNPEFFLYDFLFVYGQAFKPELSAERLQLVLDEEQVAPTLEALRITLTGPTRDEMLGYVDAKGKRLMTDVVVAALATVSEHMALKKGDGLRTFEDMISTTAFDSNGHATLLGGELNIEREGPTAFRLSHKKHAVTVDLAIHGTIVPFATLPVPKTFQTPQTFAVKPLGTRNGFDLSGPTTGFAIWVNGRVVLYDGPVGTRYLLASQGISPEDVDVIVLSHCHEDHMGAFVELFLSGYRPRVLTTEPIYRSALVKLSSYFSQPIEQIEKLIDYQRVVPGSTLDVLGARFDFFYTVHSIPTIGIAVSLTDHKGVTHRVQISGDTMHHEGLDSMHADGVIGDAQHKAMRDLVPGSRIDNAYFFADVGEAMIHGHPKDWAENPNRMLYYHCADSEHTRSFGCDLAMPGQSMTLVEPRKLHPATPGRLLSALRFMDWRDPSWFQTLLFRGHSRTAEAGEILVAEGQDNRILSVIVSGQVRVSIQNEGRVVGHLGPGEFFGGIEFVDQSGHYSATVIAATPVELFEFETKLLHDHVLRRGMRAAFEAIWSNRPGVDTATLFAGLHVAEKNRIAEAAQSIAFQPGDVLIPQNSVDNDFYLLSSGQVGIFHEGEKIAEIGPDDEDNFFGEQAIIEPKRKHFTEIRALSAGTAYRINTDKVAHVFTGHTGLRYELMVALGNRKG